MTKDEAIRKVQKLLRLATSPNEHEAALAAMRAKEILTKYNLTGFEINEETGQAEFVKEYTVPLAYHDEWINELSKAVKTLYNCDVFVKFKGAKVYLVFLGEEVNAKIASYVCAYLIVTVEEMSQKAWENEKARNTYNGFTFISCGPRSDIWFDAFQERRKEPFLKSYKIGLAVRLIEKIMSQVKAIPKEQALVLYMQDSIDRYVKDKYGGAKELRVECKDDIDNYAANAGYMAGERVDIRPAIEESKDV